MDSEQNISLNEINVERSSAKRLTFTRQELDTALNQNNYSPQKVIDLFKKDFKVEYESDARVDEGYSIEKHTLLVMGQFDKYFSSSDLPNNIDKNLFRIILALHDIGKPEAIKHGSKELQHEYTFNMVNNILTQLGFTDSEVCLAQGLVTSDFIGNLLRGYEMPETVFKEINLVSSKTNQPPEVIFDLLTTLYQVDAGSYTSDAEGGLGFLDYLFKFDHENRKMGFSDEIQQKMDSLRQEFMKSHNYESTLEEQELRQFWEEKISRIAMYHGTSENNSKEIMKKGFSPGVNSFDFDDFKFVKEELESIGENLPFYRNGTESNFYTTISTNDAIAYALSGPEFTRISFYPEVKHLVDELEIAGKFDSDTYRRSLEIKQQLLKDIYNHRPVLLKIKEGSDSSRMILRSKLSDTLFDACFNYESFNFLYKEVRESVRNSGRGNDDLALSLISRSIRKNLGEVSVNFEIKPTDLELIDGKNFDSLTEETRKYARVREVVFGNEKRQPSELLKVIVNFLTYSKLEDSDNDLEKIKNVCSFYEIDNRCAESLFYQALALKMQDMISDLV